MEAARRCSGALGLGYVGVDIVIDAARGAQVLECNAFPGLEIQNVNAAGLAGRIDHVERLRRERQRELRREQDRSRTNGMRPPRPVRALAGMFRPAGLRIGEAWTPLAVPA